MNQSSTLQVKKRLLFPATDFVLVLCLNSSWLTRLPHPCSWSSHSARPQTVTPAEKINICPHCHDDTGDNDADRRYHGDSSHRHTFVVSERRPYLLCKCLCQWRCLITFEPDWHSLMENKWVEPHLMHGILLMILVWSLRRDMKGDGYSTIRCIVMNESERDE